MIKVTSTYAKLTSALNAFSLGLSGGAGLDVVKKAAKAARKIRDAAVDVEEAIKLRSKDVRAQMDKVLTDLPSESHARITEYEKGGSKLTIDESEMAALDARKKINAAFEEEVTKVNKDTYEIEVTEDNLEALKDVLGRIDWTSAEIKVQMKEGKINIGLVLNVDEFIEDISKALLEAQAK